MDHFADKSKYDFSHISFSSARGFIVGQPAAQASPAPHR